MECWRRSVPSKVRHSPLPSKAREKPNTNRWALKYGGKFLISQTRKVLSVPTPSLDALRCTFFLGVGFLIGLFVNTTEEGERRFVQRLRETLDQVPTKILTIYTLRRVWRQFLDENEDT